MPIILSSESYNTEPFLQGNAGDWIDGELTFSARFSIGSGVSNKITYNNVASNYTLTIQTGDFGAQGFLVGDSITLIYQFLILPGAFASQSFTTTVTYIIGNVMHIADPFTLNPLWPPNPGFEHINGRQFPTENYVNGLLIVANKFANSQEFAFNLTPNGSASMGSVIDGEQNRFELQDADTIGVGVPTLMTQMINRSGGLIKDVFLEYLGVSGDGTWKDYKITYKLFQWGIIKDGYPEPNYYDSVDDIAPIGRVTLFAVYGNPNSAQIATTSNTEANTGGYDENYNGGVNNYSPISIQWKDLNGAVIDALDYSNECTFEAIVNAPNQSNPQSTYRLGLVWRPIDGTVYENNVNTLGENLLVLAPEVDFIADAIVVPGPFLGYTNPSGAQWDFADISFEITGIDELTIKGKVIPNGAAETLFSGIADGGRRSTLWVSIADFNLIGANSDRVSLKLFDDDNYDAPTIGVQIPNVLDEVLLDHGLIDITAPIPQTTTEDDVLYRSNFLLPDNVEYEGVRAKLYAFNTLTEESFTLEDIFYSFDNVPYIAGQFQVNFITPRGFNLPPTTDRNHISLTRNAALDVPGFYALKLEYGYLSRWEYWLEQSNVNNDFFDFLEIYYDGKNKNWERFYLPPDWEIRLSYYTRLDGVDDFQDFPIGIRPYEDEDATTDWTFQVISSGITPTNLVANELHKVTADITWNVGTYSNVWAEMTIEDFESGNRWVISSVLDQGGISSNPLQPNGANLGLEVTFPSPSIARLVANIDASLIDVNKVCLSARIYSEENPIFPYEYPIPFGDQARLAYSTMYKLSPINVYNGPIMRVRRSFDDTEMDIPFNNVEIDQVALLNFTGTGVDNNGYIVKLYDQSGDNNHANTSTFAEQPLIVKDGIIQVSSNGFVAGLSDGIANKFTISTPVPALQVFSYFHVFDRISSGVRTVGVATSGTAPLPIAWTAVDRIIDLMGPVANIWELDVTSGNFLLSCFRDNVDSMTVNKDGVATSLSPFIVPYVPAQSFNQLLERTVPIFTHDGFFQEIILFINDQSANFVGIENNIKNRYNIP